MDELTTDTADVAAAQAGGEDHPASVRVTPGRTFPSRPLPRRDPQAKCPDRWRPSTARALKSPAPLKAALHELVVAANHQPIKFDPTRLFKEFGRERVLATWNMTPAEKRPETAAEMRRMLLQGGELPS